MAALTLTAPQYADAEGPFIFIAGPIQGAADWQSEAIGLIRGFSKDVHIASPRRNVRSEGEFSDAMYGEQVDWEHRYLHRSMRHGVVLFWLAEEHEHLCERAFAQTTRFELGETVAMHRMTDAHVVVGIADGFTNGRYLRRTLPKKTPRIPILETLEATCAEAVRIAEASVPNPAFMGDLKVITGGVVR